VVTINHHCSIDSVTSTDRPSVPSHAWAHLLPRCNADGEATKFLRSLEARGLSSNTVIAYGRSLESLIEFTGHLATLRLDPPLVHGFLAHLRRTMSRHPGSTGAFLSQATIAQRLVALRAYADYLVDSQVLRSNPVARGQVRWTAEGAPVPTRRGLVPYGKRVPRLPTEEQWTRLLAVLRKSNIRDQLMVTLAYDGALRRDELVTLCLTDFDFAVREVSIRPEHSKNGRGRRLIYSETTSALLRAYLPERRTLRSSRPNLFLSVSPRNRGQALTGYTWGALAARLAQEAVIPGFSTHTLRHLRLTDLAKSGLDIKELALFAGHRGTGTTMSYIHLSGRDLAPAFARASEAFAKRFYTS
jgi:integrase/recombinase XerD